MSRTQTDFEKLEGKLRLPIHVNYIAKYILLKTVEETIEVLNKGIESGIIVESKQKGYYSLKNKKSNG
jgi:hypothetical protein